MSSRKEDLKLINAFICEVIDQPVFYIDGTEYDIVERLIILASMLDEMKFNKTTTSRIIRKVNKHVKKLGFDYSLSFTTRKGG